MPAQAQAVTAKMIEPWTHWPGESINQTYDLRRQLGRSDHSIALLAGAAAGPDVTIKIVPAALTATDVLMRYWRTAAALSHPHLIRVLDLGRCERDGQAFLFIATEHAAETLAEVLPQRALTGEEIMTLLPALLDALAFLHRNQLMHGQLKPTNVLVVNDEVKLSSDGIRPIGDAHTGLALPSPYDPPEFKRGEFTPAADIWALGVTLVEALTQHPPTWEDEHAAVTLPADLSGDLRTLIERCLSHEAQARPSAQELRAFVRGEAPLPVPAIQAIVSKRASMPPVVPATLSAAIDEPDETDQSLEQSRRSRLPLVLAGAGVVAVLTWLGAHHVQGPPAATASAPEQALPAVISPAAPARPTPSAPPAAANSAVVHQVVPSVPRSASETIHGHFPVLVRVSVNAAGTVTDSSLEQEGPSKYFARLASNAARQWKFTPAPGSSTRSWLLHFDFSREQATVHADPSSFP